GRVHRELLGPHVRLGAPGVAEDIVGDEGVAAGGGADGLAAGGDGEDVAHLDEAQRSGGPGQISRSAAAREDVVGGHVVAAAGQGHPAGEEVVDDGGVLDRGVDGAGLIAAEAAVDVVVVDAVIVLVHADAGTGA